MDSETNFNSEEFNNIVNKGNGNSGLLVIGIALIIFGWTIGLVNDLIVLFASIIGIMCIILSFIFVVHQYERSILLRFGKYQRKVDPGINKMMPFVDSIFTVDIREKVRNFHAERMLTKDNVPVTIDAILRYKIIEQKTNYAILNVENVNEMIKQFSQTALRNNIGSSIFQDVLSKRIEINEHIKSIISNEATNWGLEVTGVEIRQVSIPKELEDAMSQQAQAEREKNARITYGESEVMVAGKFDDASKIYKENPVAYALRQSNMLFESIKVQGNTIVMVPAESLNSMGFGNLASTIAYLENIKKVTKEHKNDRNNELH